jgi:hypothetical protein
MHSLSTAAGPNLLAKGPRLASLVTQLLFRRSFPVLLDIERPLELQMGVLVVVDELGDGLVVATAEHARRGGLGLNWEDVRTGPGQQKAVYIHFFS